MGPNEHQHPGYAWPAADQAPAQPMPQFAVTIPGLQPQQQQVPAPQPQPHGSFHQAVAQSAHAYGFGQAPQHAAPSGGHQPFLAQQPAAAPQAAPQRYAFRDVLQVQQPPSPYGQSAPPPAYAPQIAFPVAQQAPEQYWHPQHVTPAATEPTYRVVGQRSRLRWENIFPFAAAATMLVAIVLFTIQRDEMPGQKGAERDRQAAAARQAQAGTDVTTAPGELTDAQITAKLNRASALIAAGRYEDAGLILHPLQEYASRNAQITQLHERLDSLERQNAILETKLQRQFQAEQWRNVLKTLGSIRKLHPLTAAQRRMHSRAQAEVGELDQAARERRAADRAAEPPGDSTNGGGPGGTPATPPPSTTKKTPAPDAPDVPNPGGGGGNNVGNPTDGHNHTH